MKKILWIAGGALLIGVAFYLPGEMASIWKQILYGAVAAAVFLVTFILFYPSDKNRKHNKWRITMAASILFVLFGIHFWIGQGEAQKQRQNLIDIRETIETGIAQNYVKQILLQTLRVYQRQENANDFGAVFHAHYDSLITDGHINYAANRDEEVALRIDVDRATADSVVLVAYSAYVPGKDTEFQNYDGQTGHIQAKGILTKEGIVYERQN